MPTWVAKRQRSGSEASVSVSGRHVVWLPDLAYASMERYFAGWCAANDKVADVPAVVKGPSVHVLEMDELVALLEKEDG